MPNKSTKAGGFTPLWIACQKGKDRCVRMLLEQRAVDINHRASDGRTPLYAACEGGNAMCVKLLLEAGAKKEVRRHDDSTALIVAAVFGHAEVRGRARNPVGLGAPACTHGHGAPTRYTSTSQSSADGTAVPTLPRHPRHPRCLRCTLAPHVRLHATTRSPLPRQVVELLLEAGAKLKPRDDDGTALDNARKQTGAGKRLETIALLEAAWEKRAKDEMDPDAPLIDEEAALEVS